MKTFKKFIEESKTGRCWTGYKPVPGKKPYSPGSCKKVKEDMDACHVCGQTPCNCTHINEGAFSSGALKPSKEFEKQAAKVPSSGTVRGKDSKGVYTAKTVNGKEVSRVYEEVVEEGQMPKTWHEVDKKLGKAVDKMSQAEKVKKGLAHPNTLKKKDVVEEIEQIDEKSAAWQRKEGKNPEGGLNQKGVDSYRRENPGSKLKTAVTTKPSKLKPGSAAANRRKSFCARMSGMKKRLTSAKTANDPDSRINKSLRKWNC